MTIAPASVTIILPVKTAIIMAISVWGYCLICYTDTPRPEIKIKQNSILTPFLCVIFQIKGTDMTA